ncbi:hypothetical protein HY484_02010, partial [Candidatus Woesearchaeota archaeon]|nr:hypothetical protein [Candidatus Woesearchaeota archaeon]
LQDDSNISGTQILPLAGTVRNISVRAEIEGTSTAHLQFGDTIFQLSKINNSVFEGNVELQHYLPPANYSIMLIAESTTAFVNFTYLSLKKFVVAPQMIRLITVAGETISSESVVVKNVGNIPLNLSVRLNELRGLNGSINRDYASIMFGSIKKPASFSLNLLPADEQSLKLSVNVPLDAKGRYVSSIVFQD